MDNNKVIETIGLSTFTTVKFQIKEVNLSINHGNLFRLWVDLVQENQLCCIFFLLWILIMKDNYISTTNL
jgi:hypothetical protein